MKLLKLLFPIVIISLFVACNSDDDSDPTESGDVKINLSYQVDGEDLVFDDFRYDAPVGHQFMVSNYKYYLSNITLKGDAGDYVTDIVHYGDARDNSTNEILLTDVDPGSYNTLSFVFGVDSIKNVENGLPNTITNQNMIWPPAMGTGYHYMKFEGKYDSLSLGSVTKNFNLHFGASRGTHYYFEVSLPISEFEVDDNTWSIELVQDFMEWIREPRDWDFAFYGSAIMGNPDAQEHLNENGRSVFAIGAMEEE